MKKKKIKSDKTRVKSDKTRKRKSNKPKSGYKYKIVDGKRVRNYYKPRVKSDKPRKQSPYNIFVQNLKSQLEFENINWHNYADNFSSLSSKIWKYAKDLDVQDNDIESIISGYFEDSETYLFEIWEDALMNKMWWNLEEQVQAINFTKNDRLAFQGVAPHVLNQLDIITTNNLNELFGELSDTIRKRKAGDGINVSSSDLMFTIKDIEKNNLGGLSAIIYIPNLLQYCVENYGEPSETTEQIQITDLLVDEVVETPIFDIEKGKSMTEFEKEQLKLSTYETEIKVLQDEFKVGIIDKAEYNAQKEQLRLKYLSL